MKPTAKTDPLQDDIFGMFAPPAPEDPKPAQAPAPAPKAPPRAAQKRDHGDESKPEWRIEAFWPGKCGIICIGYYGDTEAEIRALWEKDPCDHNYEIQELQKLDPITREWLLVYPAEPLESLAAELSASF